MVWGMGVPLCGSSSSLHPEELIAPKEVENHLSSVEIQCSACKLMTGSFSTFIYILLVGNPEGGIRIPARGRRPPNQHPCCVGKERSNVLNPVPWETVFQRSQRN